MADGSKIEWTDATWNPIRAYLDGRGGDGSRLGWHCEHVSEACRHCYAETMNGRFGTGLPYARQSRDRVEIILDEKTLTQPLRWKKPRKIFVCSMTDLCADFVPDEMIDRVFAVMALCPQHTFQVLTKRPMRMRAYAETVTLARLIRGSNDLPSDPVAMPSWPLPNVWIGVTAENQEQADKRIPDLLATPAARRFVSIEPMLGPVNLLGPENEGPLANGEPTQEQIEADKTGWFVLRYGAPRLDWVICGGESGRHARPTHPDWARSLRDQCVAAGVPFFFKQWGEYLPVGQSLPGCGKVHGATAVKPGRMKLHFGGTPKQPPKHAFAERGVPFDSTADGRLAFRVGKKRAGRLLDGREHNEFPEVCP